MIKNVLVLLALVATLGATAQSNVFKRTIAGTGGTRTDTLDNGDVVVLELSTDDVEQENDEVDSRYDDDLDAGWEGDPEDLNELHMGLRFQDLFIPKGATVDSAFIVLHAHEGKSAEDVAKLTIHGEAADNPPTFDEANFNEDYLLTDRPKTSESVKWTVEEEWIIWQPYKTANIGPIVQELVNRNGWESGNAMAFIFEAENQGPSVVENAREFTAFENIADPDDVDPEGNPGDGKNHPERRPYLMIYLSEPLNTDEVAEETAEVYPNPVSSNVLHVDLDETAPATISIYNLNGEKLQEVTTTKSHNTLNLEALNPQLYMVEIIQQDKIVRKKIIVQ